MRCLRDRSVPRRRYTPALLALGLLLPPAAHPHSLDELLAWPLERLLLQRVLPHPLPAPLAPPASPSHRELPR